MTQITLATLAQASRQSVFDQMAIHLLTQNAQSIDFDDPVYHGPNGLMSAAGCLISTHEHQTLVGGENNRATWDYLVSQKIAPKAHVGLIKRIEAIHDIHPVSLWEKMLRDSAIAMSLNTIAIDKYLGIPAKAEVKAIAIRQAAEAAALQEYFSVVPTDMTFDQIVDSLENDVFPRSGAVWEPFGNCSPIDLGEWLNNLASHFERFATVIIELEKQP